ncbi:hypothetical protein PVAP13_9NG019200 [Panicum virgatum]|uniref:COP1-interacting protein 7 n=1 Tax=Panicum virgatum TaxID=38727 RepID=A0A8T0MAJ8_PANVG|nr:hypothetical protein PVAP13_9NG019200 [Panicum virgatum]
MRPETRLESAVFQLTPTRTRCDLVVVANGRKEKIASGLLNPFIAHLKVAQEQIAKGGYSITLEPDPEIDASWFTRGTVERFVRFVSTPEVLERVITIESEILQIEDAISVQVNESLGLRSVTVEDQNGKSVDCMEGNKTGFDPDADMSLVPYKAGTQPTLPVQNNGGTQEENSKAQLLRVLETRKTVLRKEQAMAFARAVAAGFDIDNLVYLITFAERFGASRLMKACTQFIGLWKQKHETGQWIEVEPEAMSARSEFPPFNPSGIMFMGDSMKQTMETMSVSNGDASEDASKADQRTIHHSGAPHEFFHGPYQSAYPPLAMHPPYSMQGIPYYPGMNPYYPPPYPPIDDTRYHHSERRVSKKYSDSKDSETSDDESDQSGSERETSYGHWSHNKNKRTGKKKPSVVVIRNINVTSKRHGSSEIESQTGSDKISDAKAGGQLFYEPDELMPERGCENISFGYDPAMDYSQMQSQPATMVEDSPVEEAALTNAEVKKPEKDKRIRNSQESLDKRRKDASVRRLSSSKGPMTDAQKRAQNLRVYKADLQKAKKEQEEEQMKRLERLKLERQKRIAARSSTSSASTTLQQPKVKPSSKVSPSTCKSSKFSDAEPASSSPLRKFPAKTTTGTDPHPPKTAKASKLIGNTNAVSKSTSSLTDMKEKSGKAESSSERLKKLAEPKTSGFTDHPSNPKSASVDHPRKRSMPQDTQRKKISAIMQLDQSKSATLPELKVKSPQAPAVVTNAVAAKEKKVVSHGGKAPTTETAGVKKINGNMSRMNSSDDSVVVEKTVVMLENEVVSTPPVTLHSERNSAKETSSDDRTEEPSPELEYTAIRGPPSPLILPDAESPVTSGPDDQGNSYEVVTECRKNEPEMPSLAAAEKPYQAPFARVTSLENASDYSPLPVQESESLVPADNIKARVPEPVHSSLDGNEVNEKPRSKEPKGFRKLLKFGRKSHASALTEGAVDYDASSVDESPAGDGSMLKNLISQEDSGASSKASRSFSLLSPFRSKHKVIVL